MDNHQIIEEMQSGFETAFINGSTASNVIYRPQFVSNDPSKGKKVLSSIEDELLRCDYFQISVAFITMGGITPLLQTLKELEAKNIPGEILTTNYLNFTEPRALKKLSSLKNVTLKMYDTEFGDAGFHTKGYVFKKEEIYRIIIGSSNLTSLALTSNHEWNTKIVSTEHGEMANEIVTEFKDLWNSKYSLTFEDFYSSYKERYEILKHQREIAKQEPIPSLAKYKLQPNSMQVGFIKNLREIVNRGEKRALLISATGTGKTFASAFAMRELGFKRVLFLVHRGQLARQTKKAYEKVFNRNLSMGLVGSGYSEYDRDYVFATIQTLNRDSHLLEYDKNAFDCIILDEAHHSSADTYQKVMDYFEPKLWLGMTATPDKRDDNLEGRNIYEIFNHNIAYEIRLQHAMEENLLCPFHYFGIQDMTTENEKNHLLTAKDVKKRDFNFLTSDERVRHIVEQANFFGYSGERVKGLIFCSRIDESQELSAKFNKTINPETGKVYRTIALNGDATEEERQEAFERLAMDEDDCGNDQDKDPLDYIFSVEILNEGVDIVEVNQVIMLRPTQSPIVFIQQLGRGLRKAEGKEYVVILDFIGNYSNNFMIPIALSGDRSYNPDTIRKYVISGNDIIPGSSTVHFDEISRERVFEAINNIKGIKAIIKESYTNLKNRLGRIPDMIDFLKHDEIDPQIIIREYKSYANFIANIEKQKSTNGLTHDEILSLEYLSNTILSGVRIYELEILERLMNQDTLDFEIFKSDFFDKYGFHIDIDTYIDALTVLSGHFVSKEEEYKKFSKAMHILEIDSDNRVQRLSAYTVSLGHSVYRHMIQDIIDVGMFKYQSRYKNEKNKDIPFIPYEKYSRRDVSLIMNCGKDLSSTMYGMKRIGDDTFIFVTYHKAEANENMEYAEGKPDYADAFEDNMIFRWDSQIGRGIDSSYVSDVCNAERKHLLIKKSDAERNFYYIGKFNVVNVKAAKKKNNNGKEQDITKFEMKLHHPIREDLLRYFESDIKTS